MKPPIQWARVLLDAAVIVASILLAFAIDAWWAERKQRLEEAEVLAGLHREFTGYREELESDLAVHEQSVSALAEILRAIEAGRWVSERDAIDEVIAMSLFVHTTDLGNGVRDALVQGGRLEIVSDRMLRERLARWPGYYAEILDDETNGRQMVLGQLVPYLEGQGYPMGRVGFGALAKAGVDWPVKMHSIAEDPALVARLLADPRFRAMIEVRYAVWSKARGEYEAALQAANAILGDLERVM